MQDRIWMDIEVSFHILSLIVTIFNVGPSSSSSGLACDGGQHAIPAKTPRLGENRKPTRGCGVQPVIPSRSRSRSQGEYGLRLPS